MSEQTESASYWQRTSAPLAFGSAHSGRETARVVVVGGGMMGVATAYWLARAGVDVLVLEERGVGWGASGRNGGIVMMGPADEYADAVRKFGRAAARAITETTIANRELMETVLAEEGIEAGYQRNGVLTLACSDAERQLLEESGTLLRQDGFEVRAVGREECEAMMGVGLGKRFLMALYSPMDGTLHPMAYLNGVTTAAARWGGRFLAGARAREMRREHGRWRITTETGAITAEHLVLAANERTVAFLPALRERVEALQGVVIMTEPAAIRMQVGWAANWDSEYGRQTPEGALTFGGIGPRAYFSGEGNGEAMDAAEAQARLDAYLAEAFPALRGLRAAAWWTGTMAMTEDDLPLVGAWSGQPGLWVIAGFGGQGLPFCQILPALLAEAIVAGDARVVPAYYRPQRFWGVGDG